MSFQIPSIPDASKYVKSSASPFSTTYNSKRSSDQLPLFHKKMPSSDASSFTSSSTSSLYTEKKAKKESWYSKQKSSSKESKEPKMSAKSLMSTAHQNAMSFR